MCTPLAAFDHLDSPPQRYYKNYLRPVHAEQQGLTWRDLAMVTKFLQGKLAAVLHLHGHYVEPSSVVLGLDSYQRVIGSNHAQTVQKALFLERTLLFVGCGAGLDDPNWGQLLSWAAEVLPGTDCFHVLLARADEAPELMGQHPLSQRIWVLPYGNHHSDLAPFFAAWFRRSRASRGVDLQGRAAALQPRRL